MSENKAQIAISHNRNDVDKARAVKEALLKLRAEGVFLPYLTITGEGQTGPPGISGKVMNVAANPPFTPASLASVRSVKEECLSKLILFGEASLKRALREFIAHFRTKSPRQGQSTTVSSRAVGANDL
jgi:hypothetical protein